MANDRRGNQLHVGDVVSIPCVITGLDKHDEFFNVALETIEQQYPGKNRTPILLNSQQVDLVKSLGHSNPEMDVKAAVGRLSESGSQRTTDG